MVTKLQILCLSITLFALIKLAVTTQFYRERNKLKPSLFVLHSKGDSRKYYRVIGDILVIPAKEGIINR